MTLAALLRRPDRTKFAQECLDLLDLLRQQNEKRQDIDEELEHISDLEASAREILALAATDFSARQTIRLDPITGVLSDDVEPASPIKSIAGNLGTLSLQHHSPSKIDSSRNAPREDEGDIVWESTRSIQPTTTSKLPVVEGFLRDKYYKPLPQSQRAAEESAKTENEGTYQ